MQSYNTKMPYLYSLDILRFVSCTMVLITHICVWAIPLQNISSYYHSILYLPGIAMPFFFILSGFLIHYMHHNISISSWQNIKNYYVSRLAKIYPLYILLFFAYLFTIGTTFTIKNYFFYLLIFCTGVQSWFYKIIDENIISTSCFSSAWSISTELFFYIFYPIIAKFICKLSFNKAIVTLLFFINFSYTILYLSHLFIDNNPNLNIPNHANSFSHWFFYLSPYTRSLEFITGCLLAQVYLKCSKTNNQTIKNVMIVTFIAAIILICYLFNVYQKKEKFFHLLALTYGYTVPLSIIIFFFAKYIIVKSHTNIAKNVLLLGNITYALYMLQEIIFRKIFANISNNITLSNLNIFILFICYVAILLLISIAVSKYYEKTMRSYIRNFFRIENLKNTAITIYQ